MNSKFFFANTQGLASQGKQAALQVLFQAPERYAAICLSETQVDPTSAHTATITRNADLWGYTAIWSIPDPSD